jgi:hypothetical protein
MQKHSKDKHNTEIKPHISRIQATTLQQLEDNDFDPSQGQGQQDRPVRDQVRIEVRISFYNPARIQQS